MFQIKPPQDRIWSQFRRAQDITSAIDFGFAEAEQLLHPPLNIPPNPAMDRLQQPIKCCSARVESSRAHDLILTADLRSVKLASMQLPDRLSARMSAEI